MLRKIGLAYNTNASLWRFHVSGGSHQPRWIPRVRLVMSRWKTSPWDRRRSFSWWICLPDVSADVDWYDKSIGCSASPISSSEQRDLWEQHLVTTGWRPSHTNSGSADRFSALVMLMASVLLAFSIILKLIICLLCLNLRNSDNIMIRDQRCCLFRGSASSDRTDRRSAFGYGGVQYKNHVQWQTGGLAWVPTLIRPIFPFSRCELT